MIESFDESEKSKNKNTELKSNLVTQDISRIFTKIKNK